MNQLEEKIAALEPIVEKERLTQFLQLQVQRFHRDYQFYLQHAQGHKAVHFFFERVYNLQFRESGRDQLAKKTFAKVAERLKDSTREKISNLFELHDLTYYLDLKMAEQYQISGTNSDHISISLYDQLFSSCQNRAERIEQLRLLLFVFETYFEYSRRPTFKMVMMPIRVMAKVFSANSLVGLVDEGYDASTSISEELFAQFLQSIEDNEMKLINRLLPAEK